MCTFIFFGRQYDEPTGTFFLFYLPLLEVVSLLDQHQWRKKINFCNILFENKFCNILRAQVSDCQGPTKVLTIHPKSH